MKHSSYKLTKDEIERINENTLDEIKQHFIGINNPVLYILQTHLYSENLLERLLIVELPKGKKLINEGRLTFFQKIKIVESLDIIDGPVLKSLYELNKVRNSLTHKLNHEITSESITNIGLPFGDKYSYFVNKSENCLFGRLQLLCNHLIARLASFTMTFEFAINKTHIKSDEN